MRIVICGGPKTGKTTMSEEMETDTGTIPAKHTDDLQHLDWSDASKVASYWLDNPGPWVIEGVAAVRALRKWLARNPTGKPCDRVVLLTHTWGPLTAGQETMTKGHATIWNGIRQELLNRDVDLVAVLCP